MALGAANGMGHPSAGIKFTIYITNLKKNLIRKFIKELSSLNTKATLRPKHVFYKLLSVHFISSLEDIKANIIQNLTF